VNQPGFDITRKSRPIAIVPHREAWHVEFKEIGTRLRAILSTEALRIDHIGSTSVPGLAAKDVIDIQITVRDLDELAEFIDRMIANGFQYREGNRTDIFVGPGGDEAHHWQKRFFKEAAGDRSTNIHIREEGRLNQRYPLLFRDFLRKNATVRVGYEQIKVRLTEIFPENIEGYLYIKDPLMDIIFEAATVWASEINWLPDEDYL
jgi:GrpB-like predicted nucleotidyltransferase (UPF0157 family)